jgi:hypothetical protein
MMRKSMLRAEIPELSDDAVIIIYNWLEDMVKIFELNYYNQIQHYYENHDYYDEIMYRRNGKNNPF